MLLPKRVKYRRVHRGRMTGKATRGNTITYGEFGLQATEPAWITSNQIEAARIAMTRYTKRGGQVWIKIFPDKPVTKKPAETRMGSGKGSPEFWVAVVKPGRACSRLPAFLKKLPARRCVWPATSCPSRRRSSPAPRKQVSKMKASEIRTMTPEQLNEKLAGLKKDLFFLRMQHATNQLDNPLKIRETKHDIARVKTMLREKELQAGASDKQ